MLCTCVARAVSGPHSGALRSRAAQSITWVRPLSTARGLETTGVASDRSLTPSSSSLIGQHKAAAPK